MCLPSYPPGFDLTTTSGYSQAKAICSMATTKCVVTYGKFTKKECLDEKHKEVCIQNCACDPDSGYVIPTDVAGAYRKVYCRSLGDCEAVGINNVPTYTDPERVSEGDKVYRAQQVVPIPEQLIDRANQALGLEQDEEQNALDVPDYEANAKMNYLAVGIAGVGALIAINIVGDIMVGASGELIFAGGTDIFIAETAGPLAGFAAAIGGAITGAMIGKMVSEKLGIYEGASLDLMTFGFAVAGAYTGLAMALTNFAWNPWITGAIIIGTIIMACLLNEAPWVLEETYTKEFEYVCLPWPGRKYECDLCNKDPLKPCSKYRCDTLGPHCELVNADSENPICVEKKGNDQTAPVIRPLDSETSNNVVVTELTADGFSVKDVQAKCMPAFSRFEIGLETNEVAQCKYDVFARSNFEDMSFYYGNDVNYDYNHKMSFLLPSVESLPSKTFAGGNFTGELLYRIRCQDKFGNANIDEYKINICVRQGEDDESIPEILDFMPKTGKYLKYGVEEANISVIVSEPSDCRYDTADRIYETMRSNMTCMKEFSGFNGVGWACTATLANLSLTNKFYFRCKDQPWLNETDARRNAMQSGKAYEIKKSAGDLIIDGLWLEHNNIINNTIIAGSEPVTADLKAQTTGGANGKARCYFSFSEDRSEIEFYDTNDATHSQIFRNLLQGNYRVYVNCTDIAENNANKDIKFKVEIDKNGPRIIRIYNSGAGLYLVTDESASCKYSFSSDIAYANKTAIMDNKKEHSTDWKPSKKYYIECRDSYANPGTIIVNPYSL